MRLPHLLSPPHALLPFLLLALTDPAVPGEGGDAPASPAAEEAAAEKARALYVVAVRAQGDLRSDQIADVHLRFRGAIVEDGTHTIEREYWFRSADRSFRLLTRSAADSRLKSERGVTGESAFWDRTDDGRILALSRANRDHKAMMDSIRRERDDFESILRMVLLTRLDDGATRFALGEAGPVALDRDLPYEAGYILGRGEERGRFRYDVLDVYREGEPRIRLYLRTDDHTVRRVVLEDADDPAAAPWNYYFGPFTRNEAGMVVPRYLSAHKGQPVDDKSKVETNRARGELRLVEINSGLKDRDLRPE